MRDRQREKLTDHRLERTLVASVPTFSTDATTLRLVDIVSYEDFDDAEARFYWRAIEELAAERGGWILLDHVLRRTERSQTAWKVFRDGVEEIIGHVELYRHAEMVADLAAKRRLLLIGRGIVSQVEAEVPADDIVKTTQDHLLGVKSVVPEGQLPRTLRTIMEDEQEDHGFDFLVPDWLEVKDRVMLTGREGGGKTSLLRQFCVQLAHGFHPWTGQGFEPLRILQVDLQDGRFRNEREFRIIARRAGVDPFDHLYVESRDQGINVVSSVADRRWLEGLIRSTRPHVVALGPIYRMALGEDATDPVAMQKLIDFIDKMRSRYDVCWLLEAHSPKAGMSARRSWEPFGSQRFMAWPDAGYALAPDSRDTQKASFRAWRGNRDRLSKIWPDTVVWGEVWPWVPAGSTVPAFKRREKVTKHEEPPMGEAPPDEEQPF